MSTHSTSKSLSIRLYGGADDSGIIELPILRGKEPVALALTGGVYLATGLTDRSGKLLFACLGTEGSLWLNPEGQ